MIRLLLLLALFPAPALAGPVCDAVWHDPARNRDLPVRIRLPDGAGLVPLVLFSPGLGGTTTGGSLWGKAWADRGLAVIHLEHPGSDAAVYRDPGTPEERQARVRAAASGVQLQARVGDVAFILDELARRKVEGGCDLARIDLSRVGIAGHSMGAWTVQGVAGQRYYGATPFIDRRIKAAIAFSPSTLTTDALSESFGRIAIPFLSVTGSRDGAPIKAGNNAPDVSAEAQRSGPFTGMAAGDKYLLVFKDGDHMVFSGNLRREPTPADAHIQAVVATATTAFWGMTLLGDRRDGAVLRGGLTGLLLPGDRFDAK